MSRFRQLCALGILCAVPVITACGDEPKAPPGQRDVRTIGAAVSDIVYQCGAARAGYVARADAAAVARDVDVLLALHRRVDARARFATPVTGAPTSLAGQMRLAARRLDGGCVPPQARRLRDALRN